MNEAWALVDANNDINDEEDENDDETKQIC